jgi:hypothetical protein
MNIKYEPSPDFVSKTMRRIYDYEASKSSFLQRIGIHHLHRYALALGGALFGILTATRVL